MSERLTVISAKAVSRSFDSPGFRVALAIASLPGMTPKLSNGFGNRTLGPQQDLTRARSAGAGNGFDPLVQWIDLLNQRCNRDAFFPQRIQRGDERATPGSHDGDFIDHQRRKRNSVLAGDGAFQHQRASWSNRAHR